MLFFLRINNHNTKQPDNIVATGSLFRLYKQKEEGKQKTTVVQKP